MSEDDEPLVDQCDVEDKASLLDYRRLLKKWHRWMRTDPHHSLWSQIYSMLLADMTFRTIAAAANADPQSALHSPILRRAIVDGYAAGQALTIRRLVDKTRSTISLRKLLSDIRNHLSAMTRENYVCNGGLRYDDNYFGQARFDRLSGIPEARRTRHDRLPKSLIDRLDNWLDSPEIEQVAIWSSERVAHAADLAARGDTGGDVLTVETVAIAQRLIVRAAEAVWAYLIGGPAHVAVIPVFQYSQFYRFDMLLKNPDAMQKAHDQWHQMAQERDRWTDGVLEEWLAPDKT